MGKRTQKAPPKSHTLPSSPTHSFSSSSSSDFEFTISISPRKSTSNLCPADELFYKGQLLPLHLTPRISMVRTLLLASSSTSSSSDTTTTTSRDSTGSTDSNSSFSSDLLLLGDCDSSRPSSVTEEDEFKRINNGFFQTGLNHHSSIKKSKYFSRLSRFSSVFRKETSTTKNNANGHPPATSTASGVPASSSVKRMSATAREVIRKYLKKVKPLYEKLSQKQQQQKMAAIRNGRMGSSTTDVTFRSKKDRFFKDSDHQNYFPLLHQSSGKGEIESNNNGGGFSHSFSGNLRYPRRSGRSYVSSCPSSMRSSPNHSGVLCTKRSGSITPPAKSSGGLTSYGSGSYDASSMEELQNAIQGAIAHCKNSMLQNSKAMVSDEI